MAPEFEPDLAPDLDPIPSPGDSSRLSFAFLVEAFFASLIRHAPSAEAGLGSRLLYVGELDRNGRALMIGANIAGAASLAATADPVAGKQAIRDGVVDFLVTNLDEAIRILKNEIRKREPVGVCVAATPESVEREMVERGIVPDMVRELISDSTPDVASERRVDQSVSRVPELRPGSIIGGNPQHIAPVDPAGHESLLAWSVEEAPARWLPRIDAIAIDSLASDESCSAQVARRWLRFAPRYLGRLTRTTRVLRCPTPTANEVARRMRTSIESGEISVPVRIEIV